MTRKTWTAASQFPKFGVTGRLVALEYRQEGSTTGGVIGAHWNQMPTKHTNLIIVIAAALLVGSAVAEDKHEEHSHSFAQDVDAFHAALAPLWHAPAGNERSKDVCEKAQGLDKLARAIHSGNAKPLLASIGALKTKCQANAADIDGAFAQVHEAFHSLAEPKRY